MVLNAEFQPPSRTSGPTSPTDSRSPNAFARTLSPDDGEFVNELCFDDLSHADHTFENEGGENKGCPNWQEMTPMRLKDSLPASQYLLFQMVLAFMDDGGNWLERRISYQPVNEMVITWINFTSGRIGFVEDGKSFYPI